MSLSIHTNFASLVTQNTLNKNNGLLSTAMQRLGTGFRVNSAADDAAGLQIATRLNAQSRGMSVAQRNAQDAISLLQTAEGAFSEMTDILLRMKDLATQASSDTNSSDDRTAMQAEFKELVAEIESVLNNTKYAGESLFEQAGAGTGTTTIEIGGKHYLTVDDGGTEKLVVLNASSGVYELKEIDDVGASNIADGHLIEVAAGTSYKMNGTNLVDKDGNDVALADLNTLSPLSGLALAEGEGKLMKEFNLQIGAGSGETLTINLQTELGNLRTAIGAAKAGTLADHDAAKLVMDELETALDNVGTVRSSLGANINRLNHTVNNLANMKANTDMSKGRIMDADFAAESSAMTKQQMLMQAGISVLTNSNQMSGLVASLLR